MPPSNASAPTIGGRGGVWDFSVVHVDWTKIDNVLSSGVADALVREGDDSQGNQHESE
jgi:hypothetical protein